MSIGTINADAPVRRTTSKHILAHVLIIALAAVMIYPPLWMLSSAFKPSQLIFSEPGLWPREITLDKAGGLIFTAPLQGAAALASPQL